MISDRLRIVFLVLGLLLLLPRGSSAAPPIGVVPSERPSAQPPDEAGKTRGRHLIQQGLRAVEAKRYEEALGRFEEAYALLRSPKLFLNIGHVLRKLGRDAEAAAAYDRFLVAAATAPEVGDDKIQAARTALAELRAKLARVELEATPADAALAVDGQEVAPGGRVYLVPGSHTLSARADAYRPREVVLLLVAGESRRAGVTLEPLPTVAPPRVPPIVPAPRVDGASAGRGKRIWGIVAVSAGVALLGVGTYFALEASSKGSEVARLVDSRGIWDPALAQDGESADLMSKVFFAAGGAALVGGGLLYYFGVRERAGEVAFVPTRGGATFAWRGSF